MKKRIRFIINPISGVGRKDQLPKLIEKHIDHKKFYYEIVYTQYRKHAKLIATESSKAGFDIVCAVGGDGSVHEVGTALIGTKTAMAIIPVGSGNGLARHLKIPLDLVESIQNINSCLEKRIDTVLVNDKPFLGTGGYGFDALIAKKFDHSKTRGFWGYVKLVTKEYFRYKPIHIKIEQEKEKRNLEVVLCTLANSSEFGNNFCVSPESNIMDGKLELCILKPFPKWKTFYILYLFFSKKIHRSYYTEFISVKKARIYVNEQVAHYDGEPFKVRKELNVEIKPNSLKVIVGKYFIN